MEKIRIRIRDKHLGCATLVLTLGGDSGVREAIQRSGRREEGIRVHQRHPALIQGSNSELLIADFLCQLVVPLKGGKISFCVNFPIFLLQ